MMKITFNNMKYVLLVAVLATWMQSSSGEDQISIKTAEMASVGSYLVSIPQELKIHNVEVNHYKILSGNKYAKVDERTGMLSVAEELDRESLCPDNPDHCYIDVAVVVFPSKKTASAASLTIVKIQIEITDLNDNKPKFENGDIEKMISEGVEPGTHIRLDSAVDPDLGINSIQTYSIRSVDDSKSFKKFFRLQVIENIDGTKIPQLELKTSLDREKKAFHVLVLEAVDGGSPPLTGTTTVTINVTDSNDNNPTFKKDVYVVNVNEHEEVGTVVIKLVAEDKDTGMNGVIRYRFPSVVSAKDQEIFQLDQETGVISIRNKEKLDYETTKIHHLTVEANDMGQNSASVYTTVTVRVQDINDNKPEVDVSFVEIDDVTIMVPESDYDAIVSEDVAEGSFLAFVTITDRDEGKNGTVSCQIRNNDIFNLLSIEETTSRYLLKTATTLDREEMNFYDIEIEARDNGTPPQITVKTIKIKVGDVNDNAPDFVHPQLVMSVSETAKANAVVMRLKAKDIDEGENSKITYTLIPPSDSIEKDGEMILLSDIFEIDEDTGDVRLVQEGVLDAEVIREAGYMTVLAKDNGIPSLSNTTKLRVNIVDENDNSPIFEEEEYVFRMDEHSTNGKFIGQINAVDHDFDKASNGYVKYSISSYNDDDDWMERFQTDDENGYITFSGDVAELDREARLGRPFTFYAVATDSGTPQNSARVKVSIYLNDINDNAPIVTFPNVTTDIALVRISQGVAATKTGIAEGKENIASSPRTLSNAEREWSSIVTVSGSSYANNDLEKPTLTHIEAIDLDEGENAQLSFAIVDGNNRNYFGIDVQSGNITLAPGLDLDSIDTGCHVLKILVKDLGDQPKSSFAYANVFFSQLDSKNENFSRAMIECQNNPLYPHPQKGLVNSAGLDDLTLYIIIGFCVLIFIILIIIVVILIRCKCCPAAQKSRTYNCQKGENIYSSPIYGSSPGKRKKRRPRSAGNEKGGHRHSGHNGQGTVDSRSSFYSEWTASQTQIAQEKMDLVGALPTLQSEGSVASHNSAGRDSGTGDSMPSDAYHTVVPSLGEAGYPYNQVVFLPPLPTHTPSVSGYPVHHQQNMNEGNMRITKCTEDCHVYGHSDTCWMPDSLLRSPSRLTSFKQDYDSPVRNLSHSSFQRQQPHEMTDPRFQKGDPNTPYYYDPGQKFVHLGSSNVNEYPPYQSGTAGRNYSGYPDDGRSDVASDDGNNPQQPRSHPGSHAGSHAPSNVSVPVGIPHQMSVHPTTVSYTHMNPQAGRNRAYVNLQGYEDQNKWNEQMEEDHSNLSSASSNNVPYASGYIANPPPYDTRPPVHYASPHPSNYGYYDPVSYNPNYPAFLPSYDNPRPDHDPVSYEEDYSASNLLLSPISAESEYRQQWDRMHIDPATSGPYFSQAKQNNRGTPAHVQYDAEDKQNLLENHQRAGNREDMSTANSAKEQVSNPGDKGDVKLTTIDEIDAEAVVAEIDGLLL